MRYIKLWNESKKTEEKTETVKTQQNAHIHTNGRITNGMNEKRLGQQRVASLTAITDNNKYTNVIRQQQNEKWKQKI